MGRTFLSDKGMHNGPVPMGHNSSPTGSLWGSRASVEAFISARLQILIP